MRKCIVIGASPIISQHIKREKEDFVIACDGGYIHCKNQHLLCDLWVGDHDSLKEEKEEIQSILLPSKKDDTDVLYAIKIGIKKGFKDFELYGCTGGRIDHFIANIQILIFLKQVGCNGIIIDDTQSIFVLKNEKISLRGNKEMISIFALTSVAKGVTLKNLKYELKDATLTDSMPIGVSNEFINQQASIEVKDGILLVIKNQEKERDKNVI